jgi:HD-GYP domain-containing protein (c-di-GMP phosphodiesterase class II)
MGLSLRWWAVWVAVLGSPAAVLAVLLLNPGWDRPFGTDTFHFYVVSGVTLAAALAFAVVITLIQSMKETRLLFLGLAFMSIAGVFAMHGLATPGHIHERAYAEIGVSSWLSVFAGALFVALSVASLPKAVDDAMKRYSLPVFGATAAALGLYLGLGIISPDWLAWVPTDDRAVQLAVTAMTMSLLGFSAWRYYQAFLFARQPSQWAMVCVVVLLIEVQASMTFGRFFLLSWWLYHGLYAASFAILFAAWALEARRAGNIRVIADALAMRDAVTQLNNGYSQPIAELVDAIEWKDLYTLGHVRRVASFAVMIGKEIGLPTLELRRLALGAQMHDVGKIGVPDRILLKPAKLTEEEFAIIKQHVARGNDIARSVKALEQAAEAIYFHHERFDGAGYPSGLAGRDIPLHARIVAIADAYDAMTSGRVYQPAVSHEDAVRELRRDAGSHFDPELVDVFTQVMARLEGGSLIGADMDGTSLGRAAAA